MRMFFCFAAASSQTGAPYVNRGISAPSQMVLSALLPRPHWSFADLPSM